MPTTTTLLQFALACALLAIAPGPSVVLLLAVGTERGRRAGLLTAVGLALGTTAWVLVVAAGLGAVLVARPDVVDGVTALGGCYLLWLAVRAWRDRQVPRRDRVDPAGGPRGPLVDGAIVNLLNPSIAPFLAALLPTFIDPALAPAWQQVLLLGGVFVAVSTIVNAAWAIAGAAIGGRLRRAAGSRIANTLVVVAYTALAVLALWTATG